MKRYPIGIQDFAVLRKGNYLYIDKTEQVHQLAESGKYFFLSRPRRFGKSLLLSTLQYYFQGKRELFTDLWVDREAAYDWQEYAVVHFSFSSSGYQDIGLKKALLRLLDEQAKAFHIELKEDGLAARFRELIQELGQGEERMVLLIDEYDKPLVDYLTDLPQAKANRSTMKNFFSVIKDCDIHLRFLLITGVSKFSKVSIFSDLNHLKDITLHPRHASLVGYTPAEMETYFSEAYLPLAKANNLEVAEVKTAIQRWYNGYQWEIGSPVYNPFSVLNLFDSGRFANYWWETGTPTFLLDILRKEFQFDLDKLEVGSSLFESYTLENLDWRSLLFQTGYLTIQGYDPVLQLYQLGYPNREVKDAMSQHLLATFGNRVATESQLLYANIKRALDSNDLPRLISAIDTLFSTIPYQIFEAKREGFFHAVLHLTFQGLGLLTQSEVSTAKGRVDTIVHSESGIYVMEFKLDAPVQEAMDQIRNQRYGSPYLESGQPITAVGISFSSKSKSVADWKAVPYAELLDQG